MGSKEKREKKQKKEKHKRKSKKERHEKRHRKEKRHRRHSSSSSSGSSSDSDGALDVTAQLAKSRAAARATREILAYNYELRKDLRELVRQLDAGGALEVSGIPDEFLRSKLCTLFDNLVQLKKTPAGQYFKRQSAAPVLSFIAPLLEESPASLAAYAPKAPPPAPAAAATAQPEAANGGGATGSSTPHEQQQQPSSAAADSEGGPAAIRPAIGPAGPPLGPAHHRVEGLVESEVESEGEGGSQEVAGATGAAAGAGEDAVDRRVLGPSMPTTAQLEAAAAMEYPESEEEEEEEDLLLVGPPPPEIEEEANAASMDERTAEVVRIAKVLAQHAAAVEGKTAAEAAQQPPDPYDVLGLAEDTTAGAAKKRYWQLSLLIHPDKCEHPQAHDAFQAVSRAAKELQDAGLRKAADDRRQEKQLRAEFEAEQAAAERERQWRIARGEATAADLAGPSTEQFGGPSRDAWMTELPPERQAGGGPVPSMAGQIGFSKAGIKARGDTSDWTLTPAQRAAQLEGGSAAAAAKGPLMLTSGGADGAAAAARQQQTAAAIDQYNSQLRKKTLLEKHLEKQQEPTKKKRKKGDKAAAGAGAKQQQDWDPTQHPWRPFDREKDLGPGLDAKANPADLLKNAKALGSRFSGGQGSQHRSFL